MAEPLGDRIIQILHQTAALYYRLVLLVAPSGAGKTAVLQEVHRRIGAPLVNVNLELSRSLLELTERQRALQIPRLLNTVVDSPQADVVILDNIEMLFDRSFRQDPLRLLQGLSRNKTIVAAWNGTIEGDYLVYASPEHAEYRRYSTRDLLIISPEMKA